MVERRRFTARARAFAENEFPRVKGRVKALDAGIIASIKRRSLLLQVRARIVPSDALRYFQSPIAGPLVDRQPHTRRRAGDERMTGGRR